MTEPIYVDSTLLSAVAKCSTLAVTRHVLDLASATESPLLRSGAACHAAWAVYFRGVEIDEAMDVLRNGAVCRLCKGTGVEDAGFVKSPCDGCAGLGRVEPYEAWANEHVPVEDRFAYPNVERIMARWFETHPRHLLPFTVKPERVEVYFETPLDDAGEFVVCGIMDAFAEMQDNTYNVENKTTGRLDATFLKAQKLSAQISCYHFLAERYLGRPITGTFLNVQQLSRLPSDPSRKCKEHGVTYAECGVLHTKAEIAVITRTRYQLEEWRKTAIHLAKRYRDLLKYNSLDMIHKVRQQGTQNYSCRYCPLADWCYMERNPSYAAANFVHDPWKPHERAMARVGADE